MAEIEPWKRDVGLVAEVIVRQRMGPYDPSPSQRLPQEQFNDEDRLQAYGCALDRSLSNLQAGQKVDYGERVTLDVLNFRIEKELAGAILRSAQYDAMELHGPDSIVRQWVRPEES